MTKMAAMPIYVKNSSKIVFSGTSGPISIKLGMLHQGPKPIIVCSNDDHVLTMTFLTNGQILQLRLFSSPEAKAHP